MTHCSVVTAAIVSSYQRSQHVSDETLHPRRRCKQLHQCSKLASQHTGQLCRATKLHNAWTEHITISVYRYIGRPTPEQK